MIISQYRQNTYNFILYGEFQRSRLFSAISFQLKKWLV